MKVNQLNRRPQARVCTAKHRTQQLVNRAQSIVGDAVASFGIWKISVTFSLILSSSNGLRLSIRLILLFDFQARFTILEPRGDYQPSISGMETNKFQFYRENGIHQTSRPIQRSGLEKRENVFFSRSL